MKNNLGNKETMAINIRRYLEAKGMSMPALADAIGVPYNTVNNWCNGSNSPRHYQQRRFFGGRKALKNQRKTAFVHKCVKRVQKPFLSRKNKKIPGKKSRGRLIL